MSISPKRLRIGVGSFVCLLSIFTAFLVGKATSTTTQLTSLLMSQLQQTPGIGSTYGPNVNFGSFTMVGTVETRTNAGIVLQTSQHNILAVLLDANTVIVNPTGKKVTPSSLQTSNTISVVARVNAGGQFIALRVIQE